MMKKAIVALGIGILLVGCVNAYGVFDKAELKDLSPDSFMQEVESSNMNRGLNEDHAQSVVLDPVTKEKEDLDVDFDRKLDNSHVIAKEVIESEQNHDPSSTIETEEESESADEVVDSQEQQDAGLDEDTITESQEREDTAETIVDQEVVQEPIIEKEPTVEEEVSEEVTVVSDHDQLVTVKRDVTSGSFSQIFIREKIELKTNPRTMDEFAAILLHMCETNTFSYSLNYHNISFNELLTEKTKKAIAEAFDSVFYRYPEYMSFTNSMSYKAKGGDDQVTLTLILSSDTGMNAAEITAHRQAFFEESVSIIDGLKHAGQLYEGQSDIEKAKVLFDWVVQHAEYDHQLYPESYTGYGIFENGLGVCQGYTAAYNALCKCSGLWVEGIGGFADGEEHIWTRALFAGKDMYIDATWGDSYINSDESNYDFFMVNGESLSATHSWQ